MQVDTSVLPFSYWLLGVYSMKFIYMVISKEILFTCVIYGETFYHQIEHDTTNVSWLESYCDLERGIPT